MSEKIHEDHLRRGAIVYVRQSTMTQLTQNKESQRRQYALTDRARALGFAQVDVIDEDLGKSGSGIVERPGFQRLVTKVCAGEVGAVLSIEASRLARNGRDWHHLVDLCALVGTLVVDAEGVYDPRISNDRLLLGLKGSMSEFELSLFRERSFEALRQKARRGALRFRLPIGLSWAENGKIELDPDRRIQDVVHLVFRKFAELGSARQVHLWFRSEKIALPVKRYENSKTQLTWELPRYGTLFKMLTNAQYAGAYVFGKTGTRTHVVDGKAHKTAGHAKPRDQWTVLIRDHHPGYISWEVFERNQQTLAENAHMKKRMGKKAGRGGRALLAGMLRCRRCGRMMSVAYCGTDGRNCRYICHGTQLVDGAQNTCLAFGGLRSDQAVATALLDVVQPKAIDAALEAITRVTNARSEVRAVTLELEQARYEAGLASRRYESVDPDNRLVAGELESRWNSALRRTRELEDRVESMTQTTPTTPPVDREALLSLATNLTAVWNAPAADMRLKQRIVRMLVEEIVADVDDKSREIVLVVHWIGGRHTELRVKKPTPGAHGRVTSDECIAIIRGMAGRWSDEEIAATLNRIGTQTGTGKAWNELRVYQVRHCRLGLPAHDASAPRKTITLQEACTRLGVSNTVVRKLIDAKLLPAMQGAPLAPWEIDAAALDTPEVLRAVERTRNQGRALRATYADKRTLTLPGVT